MSQRSQFWLAFSVLLVVIAAATHFPVRNFDIGWHLKTGDHFLEIGQIPTQDHISYTSNHEHLPHFNLVSDSLLFILYDNFGWEGLILFRVLIALLVLGALFWLGNRLSPKTVILNLAIVLLLYASVRIRLLVRPYLLTVLFFTSTYILLIQYARLKHVRYLQLGVFIISLNLFLHGLWAISGLPWVIFALVTLFQSKGPRRKKRLTEPYLVYGFVAFCLLLFWAGISQIARSSFLYPFLVMNKYSHEMNSVVDSLPLSFRPVFYPFFFYIIICAACWWLVFQKKQKNVLTVFFLIQPFIWLPIGFRYSRLFIYAGIALFPLVILGIDILYHKMETKLSTKLMQAMSVLLVVFTGTLCLTHGGFSAGFGESSENFSPRGVKLLQEYPPAGKMFNDMALGGYLALHLLPEKQVFYDSRMIAHPVGFMNNPYLAIMDAKEGWEEKLTQYNVGFCVLRSTYWGLAEALLKHKDWALVFWDRPMMIFFKRTEENERFIDEISYQLFNPQDLGQFAAGNPAVQKRELDRLFREAASTPIPYYLKAKLAWKNKDWQMAFENFEQLVRMKAFEFYPETQMGTILALEGNLEPAEIFFLQGIRHRLNKTDPYPIQEAIKYYRLAGNKEEERKWIQQLNAIAAEE